MKTFFTSLLAAFVLTTGFSQTILNGSFEYNQASGDVMDMFPFVHSTMLDSSAAVDGGYMDLITSSTYCGAAQQGNWFVQNNQSEYYGAFTMAFSSPLISGQDYQLSFYVRQCSLAQSFDVGLEYYDSLNSFHYIYSGNTSSTNWQLVSFNFNAPDSARHLLVNIPNLDLINRIQLDNFVLTSVSSISNSTSSGREVNVYPNPSSGKIIFERSSDVDPAFLRILNLNGQVLKEMVMNESSISVDCSSLSPGIYFYLLSDGKGEINKGKFIKD